MGDAVTPAFVRQGPPLFDYVVIKVIEDHLMEVEMGLDVDDRHRQANTSGARLAKT